MDTRNRERNSPQEADWGSKEPEKGGFSEVEGSDTDGMRVLAQKKASKWHAPGRPSREKRCPVERRNMSQRWITVEPGSRFVARGRAVLTDTPEQGC